MKNIQTLSNEIDSQVAIVRRFVQNGDTYNSIMQVAKLGGAIDLYREAIKAEMDGLKGDVKSAEAAYENAVRGYSDLCASYDQLGKDLATMTVSRDDWKRDANECDDRHERANALVGTLKNENDSLKATLDAVNRQHEVLSDAYDRQKQLTHDAVARELTNHYALLDVQADLKKAQGEVKYWIDMHHSTAAPEFAEVGEFDAAEQIAAIDRKKTIGEMIDIYKSNYEGHVADGCQALYDAGYRKHGDA